MPILTILDEQRVTLATVRAFAKHGLVYAAPAETTLLAIIAVAAHGDLTVCDILKATSRRLPRLVRPEPQDVGGESAIASCVAYL